MTSKRQGAAKQVWVERNGAWLGYDVCTMAGTTEELIAAGYQARREGRAEDAAAAFAAAVESARAGGHARFLAEAVVGVGQIERDMGRMDAARERYAEAVGMMRGLDDPLRLAHTVRHLGDVLRKQGKAEEAVPCYEEALMIYRANAGTGALDLANTVRGFALLKETMGNPGEALELWTEARDLYDSVGVREGVAEAEGRMEYCRNMP